MCKDKAVKVIVGTVTRMPTIMLTTLEIQIRLDSGRLMEFEVESTKCNVYVNEYIQISHYFAQYQGDLPLVKEIYSITRRRKVFP